MLFWTLEVLLHSQYIRIYQRIPEFTFSPLLPFKDISSQNPSMNTNAKLSYHRELFQTLTRNICQSVDYFCRGHVQQIGPSTILPSLVVVRAILVFTSGRFKREEQWVEEKLSQIRSTGIQFVGGI